MKATIHINDTEGHKAHPAPKAIQGTGEHVCPWWAGYLLNLPIRKMFESPKKLLGPLVQPGMTVADVGCAMGFFSLPLARMVGPHGRVVCVDLQKKMLDALRRNAKRAGLLERMEIRKSSESSLNMDQMKGQIDLVCAIFVVHEMPNPEAFFKQAYELLKPKGKMLILEPKWHVSAETFDHFCQLAEHTDFKIAPYHLPRKRYAALLEK